MKVRGSLQTEYNSERTSYVQDTGTANAFAVSIIPNITAYTPALRVRFKALNTISGPCTINVNSIGPKSIKKMVTSNLSGGDILAGQIVEVTYDGTNFQMISDLPDGNTSPTVNILPVRAPLTNDDIYTVPSGRRLRSLVVSPSSNSTLRIGLTPGGDEIMLDTYIAGGQDYDIDYTKTCRLATPIYFTGISGLTQILIYTDTLTPINP